MDKGTKIVVNGGHYKGRTGTVSEVVDEKGKVVPTKPGLVPVQLDAGTDPEKQPAELLVFNDYKLEEVKAPAVEPAAATDPKEKA